MTTRKITAKPPAKVRAMAPPCAAGKKKRSSAEETAQAAVIAWAKWVPIPAAPDIEPGARVSDYLYAIPNGGQRHAVVAAKMKATGAKAGVWDLHLPIARHGFHGLWVEMKAGKNNLTDLQESWGARMRLAGHKTVVCWTSYEAEKAIADYLGIKIL